MLKLFYITNDAVIAKAASEAGVDRIFVDLETLNKAERQKGRNTFISTHTMDDVRRIKDSINKAELLVRVNPINGNSKQEIDEAISNGADILMLPMFKTAEEVETFVQYVSERCKTILLFEHIDAVNNIDDILKVKGIDEVHIGLNDLHISMNKSFMFELLIDGTVERIMSKTKKCNIPTGVGGMSRLGTGILPAEIILGEHYRLGSNAAILSRGFMEGLDVSSYENAFLNFKKNLTEIRKKEKELSSKNEDFFKENYDKLKDIVNKIVDGKGL